MRVRYPRPTTHINSYLAGPRIAQERHVWIGQVRENVVAGQRRFRACDPTVWPVARQCRRSANRARRCSGARSQVGRETRNSMGRVGHVVITSARVVATSTS